MKPSMPDTDILPEFLRGNANVIANVIANAIANAEKYLNEFRFINLSIITYYEILNGLLYKDAKKQLGKFEDFIELNNAVPLTLRDAKIAAKIHADLRKGGTEIGHMGTLIAGIAIANEMQLITNNTHHFKRIKALETANWTK